jgi:hypothetical protein
MQGGELSCKILMLGCFRQLGPQGLSSSFLEEEQKKSYGEQAFE